MEGTVFLVQNKSTEELFAAKIVERLDNFAIAKQVLRETSILKMLSQNKNGGKFIPQFVELFIDDSATYSKAVIIMEYVQGKTLKELIKEVISGEAPLTDDSVAKISYNLIHCLHFLHLSNVIHRDLKPENIIINKSLDVRIIDFGLARTNPNPDKRQIFKLSPHSKAEKKAMAKK